MGFNNIDGGKRTLFVSVTPGEVGQCISTPARVDKGGVSTLL
jgi:hypothetical protein